MKKVSDVIAEYLKELKIDYVFGIIGSANSHIFDSIEKLGYTKIIFMHHEQACVLAMGAYYRASGKLSAAIVTAGGGATNAVTGICSNWADSIPGIIICGQESSFYCNGHENLRMFGTQGLDIIHMTSKIVKYGARIDDPGQTQQILQEAINKSILGRPGPSIIDVPFDVQSKKILCKEWIFENKIEVNVDLTEIINLLSKAKRPVIVGGNGVRLSKSNEAFKTLVEKFSIPTLLTWSAIDILDNTHPLHFGRFGIYGQRSANFIVQNADFVLVLGSRLAIPQVGYDFAQFAREAKIVIVDIDKNETQKYKNRIDYILNIDCFDFINKLLEFDLDNSNDKWLEYCNSTKNKFSLLDESFCENQYVNSYKFIQDLSDYLDDDHIIVTDMGTALLSGHQTIKLIKNQKMFTSLGLGEMGYGLPGSIGAAVSSPNSSVLCLNCDGGIMMNLQEAHTIIENKLNIKIVIFNNDGYLMIKHTQKMLFEGKFTGVDKKTGVGLPKFDLLMPAFGYKYFGLSNNEQYKDTLKEFFDYKGPSVLEVFMHPEQDFIPKVKGVSNNDGSIFAPPIEEMSPLLSIDEVKNNMLVMLSEKSFKILR